MRRSFLYLLSSLVILACGETTAPQRPEVGTWRLETVDGKSLPFTLDEPDVDKYELTGETITLLATGRVTMMTSLRVTDNGNVSLESVPDGGTFTVNGSTVTFRFDSDGSTPIATVTGDTMTLGDIGLTFVYRRD
jgi:hypothetical protein